MQQTNGTDMNNTSVQPPQPQPQHPHGHPQQQWVPHMPQQQQPWMGGGAYPAAAMVMMQQQMMYPQHYPPHYMAYYQQQQLQQQQQQQQQYQKLPQQQQQHQSQQPYQKQYQKQVVPTEDSKTLWVGDLLVWMDETYLHNCFSHTGEVSSIKIIRNKLTGQPEGYGFIEFQSHATAEKVLQNYSGSLMPNTEQPFRLNWASFAADRRPESGSDLSIFVGDLAPDVTDAMLQETFASKFSSVKGAKVVTDPSTGRTKGYGFVRFSDETERTTAMTEMNGVYCSSRPMRIGVATPKKFQQYSSQALILAGGPGSNGSMSQGSHSDGEAINTTIFVGGIDSDTSDEDLKQPFSEFGEVVSVKIPPGKGCAFVQFATRKDAEEALEGLNGTVIGKQTVRLSWGRSPANKQWRGDRGNNQWNGGYSGGGQGYGGGYGYSMPPNQSPGIYAAAAASGAS